VLGIITGVMLIITILLFVFTAGGGNPEDNGTVVDGTGAEVMESVPTLDPESPPTEGMAKLAGRICVSGLSREDKGLMLVAERIPDREQFNRYFPGPINEDIDYALEVVPGSYEVFTELLDRQKLGLYSQYVECGLTPERCLDHGMVQVQAQEGQIVQNIDVCDYEWVR